TTALTVAPFSVPRLRRSASLGPSRQLRGSGQSLLCGAARIYWAGGLGALGFARGSHFQSALGTDSNLSSPGTGKVLQGLGHWRRPGHPSVQPGLLAGPVGSTGNAL